MSLPPFGIGIIGAGVIIKRHALAYRCLPELAKLVAVADIDSACAAAAQRAYGFTHTYSDYHELLGRDDIQVVSVCTPPHAHTRVVLDALAAGKHVLCEKPMAGTLEDADRAIAASDQYPACKVSYVYQYRSDPAHRRVRELIRNGNLGRLLMGNLRVRAQRTPAYYSSRAGRGSWAMDGGGVLINQAVHQLDALVSFLGNPVEVSANMGTFLQPIEAEDTLVGWAKFESGAFATIDCTVCAHEEWFEIEVLGENAQLAVRGAPSPQACAWSVESKSSAVRRALWRSGVSIVPDLPPEPKRSTELAQKAWCKLRGRKWLPPRHWGHTPHIREFLEALSSSQAVAVPPREARRSLELATALYSSAISGEKVRLPLGPGQDFYSGIAPQAAGAGMR